MSQNRDLGHPDVHSQLKETAPRRVGLQGWSGLSGRVFSEH